MKRAGVALGCLLVLLSFGCGGSGDETTRAGDENAAEGDRRATMTRRVQRLVSMRFGERVLGLQLDREHGCFGVEFSHGYGEEPWVSFSDSGCIGDRPWHVVVGAGGPAGEVGWTVVMAATRPEVERVVVSTPTRAHELEPHRPRGWEWKIFRLGINEPITAVTAFADDESLLERAEIPTLAEGPCDWICKGQGPWGIRFDLDRPVDPQRFKRKPDVNILSRDADVRAALEGKRFMLFQNDDWGGCVGVEHGGSWTFILETGNEIDRRMWPTVDPAGRPIYVDATGRAEQVVVDIDRDRGKAISLLPYDLNTFVLVDAKAKAAPLATDEPHEAPMDADDCRRLG